MLRGELKLIPEKKRLLGLIDDHKAAIDGRMFFINRQLDYFDKIIERLSIAQDVINKSMIMELGSDS